MEGCFWFSLWQKLRESKPSRIEKFDFFLKLINYKIVLILFKKINNSISASTYFK